MKIGEGGTFIFPEIEDIGDVKPDQVIGVLLPPMSAPHPMEIRDLHLAMPSAGISVQLPLSIAQWFGLLLQSYEFIATCQFCHKQIAFSQIAMLLD